MLATRAAGRPLRHRLRQPGRRPGRARLRRRLVRGRRRRRPGRPRAPVRRATCQSSTSTSGRCSASACSTPAAGPPRRPLPVVARHRAGRRPTRRPRPPGDRAAARRGGARSTRPSCSAPATTSRKNGFTDVVFGLSGGIDSSLVAAIAADALGPEHVHGVSMPSGYSTDHSMHRRRARWPRPRASTSARSPSSRPTPPSSSMLAPSFEGLPSRTSPRRTCSPASAARC